MNREDVLRMAREAGAASDRAWSASACDVREIFKLWPEELEQFAAAIRSATKEEDARICEEEISTWKRLYPGESDMEQKALIFARKAILASK